MNCQGYKGGRIVRIHLVDFMTYTELVLKPEQTLNLIIGANGSGKSSILCAICLGLAGKPIFTGRQMKLGEYVAHGCDEALIEIELHDPNRPDNLLISHRITKESKSFYEINHRIVEKTQVEKEVSRFNIQVNNLCQFLPQDKVAEFSRMNPKQLLESMQQAVGDEDMYSNYKELIKMQDSVCEQENYCKRLQETLETEIKANEVLEPMVQKYNEQESYKRRIENLQKACEALVFQKLKDIKNAYKAERRRLLSEMEAMQEDMNPKESEIELTRNSITHIDNEAAQIANTVTKKMLITSNLHDQIKGFNDQIADTENEFQRKKERAAEQVTKKKELLQQLEIYKKQYEDLQKKSDENEPQVQELQKKKEEVINKLSEIESQKPNLNVHINSLKHQELAIHRELNEYDSVQHKKAKSLYTRDRSTYDAWIWVRENRSQFRKHIYDPLLLLIDVCDANEAKILENHISMRDLTLFLCEDREDVKKLTKILREEKRLAVNVALVPPRHLSSYQPNVPLHELRNRYHFNKYLKDIFKAPDAVCVYLCDMYSVHNTPCGDRSTEMYLRNSNAKPPFRTYYTPDFKYSSKTSLYGPRNTFTISRPIREKGLLFPTGDDIEERKRAKKMELREKIEERERLERQAAQFQELVHEFGKKLETLRQEEKAFREQKEKVKQFHGGLLRKMRELHGLIENKIDLDTEQYKASKSTKELEEKKKTALCKLESTFQQLTSSMKLRIQRQLMLSAIRQKLRDLERMNEKKMVSFQNKKKEYEEANEKFLAAKKKYGEHRETLHVVFGMDLTLGENQDKVKAFMKEIPGDLEEVEREIKSLEAKLKIRGHVNIESIEEYKNRKSKISLLKREYESLQQKFSLMTAKMESKKQSWLGPLEHVIVKINRTFSRYFERLGCAGEVILSKGDSMNDINQYGLSIQVKFRDNTRLIELSQAHHSGGECNVSTILFMLSLQELTRVPFRCVDEINQGMDSTNEREIFNLIAESAARSSQYFLLTPKLLHGLEYSSNVKIHIIHNSPTLEVDEWNIKKFIKIAKS